MRRETEFFQDQELDLVYMSRRLREALAVELVLTRAEIDYFVEPGTYLGGFLFKRELTGAFFYVALDDTAKTREILIKNRYKPYVKDVG